MVHATTGSRCQMAVAGSGRTQFAHCAGRVAKKKCKVLPWSTSRRRKTLECGRQRLAVEARPPLMRRCTESLGGKQGCRHRQAMLAIASYSLCPPA